MKFSLHIILRIILKYNMKTIYQNFGILNVFVCSMSCKGKRRSYSLTLCLSSLCLMLSLRRSVCVICDARDRQRVKNKSRSSSHFELYVNSGALYHLSWTSTLLSRFVIWLFCSHLVKRLRGCYTFLSCFTSLLKCIGHKNESSLSTNKLL